MAYARRRKTSRKAGSQRRSYGRSQRRTSQRRVRRGASAGPRTLRIVIEQAGENTAARPELVAPTASRGRKAKF